MTRTGELNEMATNVSAAQRRSYVGIAAALLALVFVIVAGAFLLNRQLRPRVGIEAIAGPSAVQESEAPASRTISSESEIGLLATPLQREVATAYLRYWTVYGAAMENRDTTRLAEAMAGDRLQQASAEVEELRSQGVAAKIQVKHSFSVTQIANNEATIQDHYVNASYAVDPQTRVPIGEPGKSQQIVNTYSMTQVNGTWKVTDVVREPL